MEEAEPAPVETHWWDGQDGYQEGSYTTTMFGDIDAVKYTGEGNYYRLIDMDTEISILTHREWTPNMLNLERELPPAQYRQLVEEYGHPVHVTMETIDTDGGGMDKVAVRYEGGKGVGEFITDYEDGLGVQYYLSKAAYYNLFT